MLKRFSCLAVLLLFLPGAALAQLGLPGVPLPTGGIDRVIDRAVGTVEPVVFSARELTQLRAARIEKLVRSNPKLLELTTDGYPARRGEILMFEPSEPALSGLRILGFRVLEREAIEGLDLPVTRLQLPPGVRMREVSALMDRAAPGVRWTPDHVYEQAGRAPGAADLKAEAAPISARVGVIDGAPGENQRVAASKGFARGAPTPSNHGSAVVSLLRRAGVRSIAVADVYGTDPAGGSATAVARALGWLVADGAKVITMSLVGADNLLLSRAVTAARGKGVVIVAPVGNDGPASPYAYPASYPGVVAVTGVDGRNRALIEAGRALDLDYAAPAADMTGSDARGRRIKLRGTSFAAPLAAARIAAAIGGDWRAATDNEAIDLGKRGADSVYGRGLLCGKCR
jgi:hypothetical protein